MHREPILNPDGRGHPFPLQGREERPGPGRRNTATSVKYVLSLATLAGITHLRACARRTMPGRNLPVARRPEPRPLFMTPVPSTAQDPLPFRPERSPALMVSAITVTGPECFRRTTGHRYQTPWAGLRLYRRLRWVNPGGRVFGRSGRVSFQTKRRGSVSTSTTTGTFNPIARSMAAFSSSGLPTRIPAPPQASA